jgi:hypothetical protein
MLSVLHGHPQVEADLGEPGLLGVAHQVAVVEVHHGIVVRLDGLVQRLDLRDQRLDRADVVAEEPAGIAHQDVDRLEHADAPARPEHPVELSQRGRLVFHVDKDGPGGDHIDRGVRHPGQRIGRGQQEPGPAKQTLRLRRRAAVIEQVLRDVGEDHPTGRAEPVQRTEGDQAVPGAHVEHGIAGLQLRLVEDRLPDRVQELSEHLLANGGVAAEPHVRQPSVPAVRGLRHNRSLCPHRGTAGAWGLSGLTPACWVWVPGCAELSPPASSGAR